MATAAQQTQPSQQPPAHDPPSGDQELLWEGDKMFNIYIWDYCNKRKYHKTAQNLAEEANLAPHSRPPIDAKQGLLYEWWSVFWVLFSAKSNGTGPEDAMVYVQHHMAQVHAQRMQAAQGTLPRYAPANGVRPGLPGAQGQGQGMPPGGGPPGAPGAGPGPMPNGIAPGSGPGPGQPPPPAPLGFPSHPPPSAPAPQPNGIHPGTPTAPGHPNPNPSQQQQNQNQQQQQQQQQNQQGQGNGPPQPPPGMPRPPPPGVGARPPFQSPTMAHTQNPGAGPGPSQQQQGPPYPMGGHMGLGMPPNYPHMRMMPPGMNVNGVHTPPGGAVSAASPGYNNNNNNAQSGSRAATPAGGPSSQQQQQQGPGGPGQGQGGHPTPSPSLTHRTVPQTPPAFGPGAPPSLPQGGRPPFEQLGLGQNQITAELHKIDQQTLGEIRNELGMGNKDLNAMSHDEKSRLLNMYRHRNTSGPSNPAAQRNQQGRGSKRNSVSPADEQQQNDAQVKGEASPPANKRARRSPDQNGPQGSGAPTPSSNNAPGNASNNAPPPGPGPMPGVFPPGAMPNGMRGPPYTPSMSHMNPGMMAYPGGPSMVTQQMTQQMTQQLTQQFQAKNQQQYRPDMQGMHKMGTADPSSFGPGADNNQNQPRSAPPVFAPGQGAAQANNNRPGAQNKPGMMPPPSSPATNGIGKPGHGTQPPTPQGSQGKLEGAGSGSNNVPNSGVRMDTSPRSVPPATPSSTSTGPSPPTPAPASVSVPGASAPSPSHTAGNPSRPATASANPNASAAVTSAPSGPAPPSSAPPTAALTDTSFGGGVDFMSMPGFDDFPSMFPREDDLNFERDFGAWFSEDLGMLNSSK